MRCQCTGQSHFCPFFSTSSVLIGLEDLRRKQVAKNGLREREDESQVPEAGEEPDDFGVALAAGDVDGDFRFAADSVWPIDDLAMSAPGEEERRPVFLTRRTPPGALSRNRARDGTRARREASKTQGVGLCQHRSRRGRCAVKVSRRQIDGREVEPQIELVELPACAGRRCDGGEQIGPGCGRALFGMRNGGTRREVSQAAGETGRARREFSQFRQLLGGLAEAARFRGHLSAQGRGEKPCVPSLAASQSHLRGLQETQRERRIPLPILHP